MTEPKWETLPDRGTMSRDYILRLPRTVEAGRWGDPADVIHRWYDHREHYWVVAYGLLHEEGPYQVGPANFVATKDEALAEGLRLYRQAEAFPSVGCRECGCSAHLPKPCPKGCTCPVPDPNCPCGGVGSRGHREDCPEHPEYVEHLAADMGHGSRCPTCVAYGGGQTALPKPLKVTVTVTVEVDREAYALAYGTRDAATIRDHVKSAYLDGDAIFASDSGISVVDAR